MKFPLAAMAPFLALAACAQQQFSPQLQLSPDGRSVAFLEHQTEKGSRTVAILDRTTGTLSSFPLPGQKPVDRLMWLDGCLYAGSHDISDNNFQLLDPLRNTWTPAPPLFTIWYQPFIGTYSGQPALFLPESATDIRSLTTLAPIGKLDYPVRGVGDGYMLRYHWPADARLHLSSLGWMREDGTTPNSTVYRGVNIESMDLLDPQFHIIMTLTAAGAAAMKIPFTDRQAQISPDHKTLLLAPGPGAIEIGNGRPSFYPLGFAVIDIATTKLLYPDPAARAEVHQSGTPVTRSSFQTPVILTNEGLYGLQEVDQSPDYGTPPREQDRQYWLVRFSSEGFKRLIQISLTPGKYYTTTSSASAGIMLIHSLYPTPHILEVPLKPNVTPADIRQFPLPE